jgi:hypothetical protein
LHPTWRREGEILGKKEEIRLNKYRGKTAILQIMLRDFVDVPTALMAMLTL